MYFTNNEQNYACSAVNACRWIMKKVKESQSNWGGLLEGTHACMRAFLLKTAIAIAT